MKWSDLGRHVADYAPLLGGVLLGPAGAAGGKMLAHAFGTDESPEAVHEAMTDDPNAPDTLRMVQEQNRAVLEQLELQTYQQNLHDVNKTMRVESKSDSNVVKFARPFLIYSLGLNLNMMIMGALYLIHEAIVTPEISIPETVNAIATVYGAIGMPLSILAGAAGVYVRSRSTHDKPLASGQEPPQGLIQRLLQK